MMDFEQRMISNFVVKIGLLEELGATKFVTMEYG